VLLVFSGGHGYDETQGYLSEDFSERTKGVGLVVPSWAYRPPLTLSNIFLSLISIRNGNGTIFINKTFESRATMAATIPEQNWVVYGVPL
jgi:hypothetical protein